MASRIKKLKNFIFGSAKARKRAAKTKSAKRFHQKGGSRLPKKSKISGAKIKSPFNKIKKAKKQKLHIKVRRSIPKKSGMQFLEENKNLLDFLHNIVGEEGMQVVEKIVDKEVTDGELSEKIDLKPNIIRKHLYALYEAGVVTYRRHRSKTGWYTYYWKLNPDRISLVINEAKEMEAKKLEEMLKYEKENSFFECKNKCERFIFDAAMEREFKCQKCNNALEAVDNSGRIAEIETRISELRGRAI